MFVGQMSFQCDSLWYVRHVAEGGPSRPILTAEDGAPRYRPSPLESFCNAHEGMSSNGANGPTQRPRVGNVWPCYWLSNRSAKTRHITSQSWAAVGAPRRWASFVAAQASAKVPPWICSDHRASRDCVIATGQPSYWRWMATFGTMFWRSALERRQTGLFGPRCRFAAVEAPKLSDRAGPTRDRLED